MADLALEPSTRIDRRAAARCSPRMRDVEHWSADIEDRPAVWLKGTEVVEAVGESYFQEHLVRVAGPPQPVASHQLEVVAWLSPEPIPQDPKAVALRVQGGLVGPVTHRLGETNTLRFGLISNSFGLLVLAFDLGWAGLVIALLLLTVGQGLLTPTLSSAVAGRAGLDTGVWLGWQQSAGGAARVIGPLAAGALFQWAGMGWPYAVGAALAVFALTLVPSRPKAASTVTAG